MKGPTTPTHPVTDAAAVQSTGRSLRQWFAALDEFGGPAKGRAAIGKFLQGQRLDSWWSGTITVEYERAREVRDKDGRPKGYSICVTKVIAAPVTSVFDRFADARSLDQWLGPGTRLTFVEGAEFSNADGNRGTITRITRPRTIRLTWEDPSLAPASEVEILFQPKGDSKTGLVVNHTRVQERGHADGLRQAWEAALTGLKAVSEGAENFRTSG